MKYITVSDGVIVGIVQAAPSVTVTHPTGTVVQVPDDSPLQVGDPAPAAD